VLAVLMQHQRVGLNVSWASHRLKKNVESDSAKIANRGCALA